MENMNNRNTVKRGEIYLFDFGDNEGSIQNGVRPVLVVQSDEGNAASCTTVIAAMTSVVKKRYLPTHIILGDRFGLKEPSMVMLEQLKTVNQDELGKYIGTVDDEFYMKLIISSSSLDACNINAL
jgi:mRNA interferase MazF